MRALDVREPGRRERLALAGATFALLVGVGSAVLPVSSGAVGRPAVYRPGNNVGTLNGVSCVSDKSCFAVGYRGDRTLIESGNGTTWSIAPSPDRGFSSALFSVSCPSARSCVAAGGYVDNSGHHVLFESWNGSSWSVVPSPSPGPESSAIYGVFCVSPRSCVAVGGYGNAVLVESLDGTTWSVVPSPRAGSAAQQLGAVSCRSARSCAAVGSRAGRTLVESWDGRSWSVVPSPTLGTFGGLASVSCASAGSCVAVGDYSTGTGSGSSTPPRALTESWNGRVWSVVPNPSPSHAYLFGVSCVAARSCKAVGEYEDHSDVFLTMIESWNGRAWSVVPAPSPPSADLYGLSCVSANWCKAVGESASSPGGGVARVLVESWDGSRWRD